MNTFTQTRAPPPQGPPPSYAFVTRVYNRSLKPVVVFMCFLSGLWALAWGIASFRDISIDKDHAVRLEVFDIVLGVLYMVIVVIELFGIVSAFLERTRLVRIYAILSLGAVVVVIGTELLRIIIHFVYKSTLINECESLVNGDEITTRFGFWGTDTTTLNTSDGSAQDFCNSAYNHDTFNEFAWFFVTGILGLLFASTNFAYYRQLVDPNYSRTQIRSNNIPKPGPGSGPIPSHYNPPYAGGAGPYGDSAYAGNYPGFGGNAGTSYAPPAGPPPGHFAPEYDAVKLPGYEADGYSGMKGDYKGEEDARDITIERGVDPFADREASAEHERERL